MEKINLDEFPQQVAEVDKDCLSLISEIGRQTGNLYKAFIIK
jgi:hypothetical protein